MDLPDSASLHIWLDTPFSSPRLGLYLLLFLLCKYLQNARYLLLKEGCPPSFFEWRKLMRKKSAEVARNVDCDSRHDRAIFFPVAQLIDHFCRSCADTPCVTASRLLIIGFFHLYGPNTQFKFAYRWFYRHSFFPSASCLPQHPFTICELLLTGWPSVAVDQYRSAGS